ncbi:corticoliberin isoform X1 [Camelus ferus]|uniref:Corticoliberin isoform X1 n=1 Tax=Camelus ferus TaxID=419612 RepID=A0A8B8S6A0_CAMFR|nr:uncharacterized protein LOC116149647 isoform X1 [Camelus dromedarius]XP_032325748.1 corticoliberin isoform X1 [Camelus ferus]
MSLIINDEKGGRLLSSSALKTSTCTVPGMLERSNKCVFNNMQVALVSGASEHSIMGNSWAPCLLVQSSAGRFQHSCSCFPSSPGSKWLPHRGQLPQEPLSLFSFSSSSFRCTGEGAGPSPWQTSGEGRPAGEWAWELQEMWLGSWGTESGRRSVREGLVMAHLRSACSRATNDGFTHARVLERLGEEVNWKGSLMQHIISILVDISYDGLLGR